MHTVEEKDICDLIRYFQKEKIENVSYDDLLREAIKHQKKHLVEFIVDHTKTKFDHRAMQILVLSSCPRKEMVNHAVYYSKNNTIVDTITMSWQYVVTIYQVLWKNFYQNKNISRYLLLVFEFSAATIIVGGFIPTLVIGGTVGFIFGLTVAIVRKVASKFKIT